MAPSDPSLVNPGVELGTKSRGLDGDGPPLRGDS